MEEEKLFNNENTNNFHLYKYLEENYKKFKSSFLFFPINRTLILAKYYDFLEKNFFAFKFFFSTQMIDFNKNSEISELEIENIIKAHILDKILKENFSYIYQEILKNIKEFKGVINFEKEVNFDYLIEFLKDAALNNPNDNVFKYGKKIKEINNNSLGNLSLKLLLSKKDHFIKNDDSMKNLKDIVKLEQKNKDDKTFIEIINKMIQTFSHFFIFFLKYFEIVFEKFEFQYEFRRIYSEVNEKLIKMMNKDFKKNQNLAYKLFFDRFKGIYDNISMKLDENLSFLNENNPKKMIVILKEYRDNYFLLLKESLHSELDYKPSNLLIYEQLKEINAKINNKFIEKFEEFHVSQTKLLESLEEKMIKLLNDYILEKEVLFNTKKLQKETKNLLLVIIIASIFIGTPIEDDAYIENMTYIGRLQNAYFEEKNDNDLELLMYYLKDRESFDEHVNKIKIMLKRTIEQWNIAVKSEEINLYAMFSIIIDFQNLKPLQKTKDNKKIVLVESFSTKFRIKIMSILRNLHDFDFGYNNSEILVLLEFVISKLIFPIENGNLLKLNDRNLELYKELLNNFVFEPSHSKGNEEFVRDIRSINLELLDKKTTFLMKRVQDIQIKQEFIEAPTYFQFEKLTKIESRSRVINVCISGFLSQGSNKRKEWADLIDSCERNNSELLSLKWQSSHSDELIDFLSKSYSDLQGLGVIHSYLPVVGMAKLFLDNPFIKSFEEAKRTGFYLAHLIGDLEIFGNNAINLIGFSMGTIVIYECLLELQRMRKYDKIHDVVVMGGIIKREEMKNIRLNMISGWFYHCFSKKDWAIKFLYRLAKFGEKGIGVKRIEECADDKIRNFDCSDIIDGHMTYRVRMKEIFKRIDFNQDVWYLEKELMENGIFEFENKQK